MNAAREILPLLRCHSLSAWRLVKNMEFFIPLRKYVPAEAAMASADPELCRA